MSDSGSSPSRSDQPQDPNPASETSAASFLGLTEPQLKPKVIEMLKRAPNVGPVVDNHGSSEFGVDILFVEKNSIGIDMYCGIQLKALEITAPTALNIIGQATVAFGHPFLFGNEEHKLDLIYVMTSRGINSQAREYFKEMMTSLRNVKLLYGEGFETFMNGGIRGGSVITKMEQT